MNYRDYNDNELLSYISENNEDATDILYKKYMPIIKSLAKKMYQYTTRNGIEISDLEQEGLLGLSSAIAEYDESKDVTFYTFAKTCIERKIISAVIATRRLKHKFLNDSLPLEIESNGNRISMEELLGDNKENPEEIMIDTENFNELIKKAEAVLTDFEMQVFELRISEFGYKEIAEILDKDYKSVDNALQRIRMKLKKVLNT